MSFKQKIYAIFMIMTLLINSTESLALDLPKEAEFEGRTIKVEQSKDYNKRVTQTLLPKGKKYFKVTTYSTMYLSFLFWMTASEVWYCDKSRIGVTANFDETALCRKELFDMAQDPSMYAGIFAMTTTSLAFNKWSDKKGRNVLLRALGKKAKTPYKLLQTFSQSVGMGFGITAQTLTTSLYNSPSVGKCFKEIKNTILNGGTAEDAMATEICKDGWESFINLENGTLSEINIAITSLLVSSVATATTLTTIRGAGLVIGHLIGKTTVLGWGMTALMVTSNGLIEFFDRYVEKYIRAYYHNRRASSFIKDDFTSLIEELRSFKESEKMIFKRNKIIPCRRIKGNCNQVKTETEIHFPLLEGVKNYSYNINYKRRATLNTFIDSQANWRVKLSGVLEIFSNYKDFLNIIQETRKIRSEYGRYLEGTGSNYNPFFIIGLDKNKDLSDVSPEDIQGALSLNEFQKDFLTKKISNLLKIEVLVKAKNRGRKNMPFIIYQKLETALNEIKNENYESLHINLWELKELSNKYFIDFKNSLIVKNIEEEDYIADFIEALSPLSSVSPLISYQLLNLKSKGLGFDVKASEEASEEDPNVVSRGRKNIQLDTEDVDVLKLHESVQSEIAHSEHKFINFLTHSACNPNKAVIYNFNPGYVSKLTMPNLISSDATQFECSNKSLSYDDNFLSERRTRDFYFIPDAGKRVEFETSTPMQTVYTYNGKKYIGLFELLTDPDVTLKWNSKEELEAFWSKEIMPKYYDLLTESRARYQNLLFTEFYLFDTADGKKLKNADTPLEREEISYRMNPNLKHRSDSYYENISPGDSFLDQVRMLNYVLKSIGTEKSKTDLLNDLRKNLEVMLDTLDVKKESWEKLNPYGLKSLYTNPLDLLIGVEKHKEFKNLRREWSKKITKLVKSYDDVPDVDLKKDDLSQIDTETAKLILEKAVFKSIEDMYKQEFTATLYKDYLTAEGYLYSEKLSD